MNPMPTRALPEAKGYRMRPILLLFFISVVGCSTKEQPRTAGPEAEVVRQRRATDEAVAAYVPAVAGDINDLSSPAADILRRLPGVVEVEVLVAATRPTRRIVHVRDWHYVPRDIYSIDFRAATGQELTDQLHDEFLLGVELVQVEQAGVLRCLVGHHGLRRVISEGLTPKGVAAFREVVDLLREADRDVAATVEDHAGVRGKSAEIDREVDRLVGDHRLRLLEYGTPGLLAMRREVEELPLDENDTLDAANPVTRGGGVDIDRAKSDSRHDSQVKLAVASGSCSVLVLGGSHDLSASVRNLGGGVEYIRLATRRYRKFAGR